MEEIWIDIDDYKGLYQVSNFGNVRRLMFINNKCIKNKIKSLKINNTGKYSYVFLSKNGLVRAYSVHRLVAKAFIPNPNNLPQINHKDENKHNNCVDNLEWCTNLYNMNYGNVKSKISEANKNKPNIKSRKPVIQFDRNMNYINKFNSIAEASKQTLTNKKSIILCCNEKRKTANNYIWRYDIWKMN